jgi:hypothetical protein
MLVVEPTSSRFEGGEAAVSTNEHLLERISATENRITRLAERLERSLDLMLRQAQNSSVDRSLVKVLVDVLAEDGLINKERLEELWAQQCEKDGAQGNRDARQGSGGRKTVNSQKKRVSKRTRS